MTRKHLPMALMFGAAFVSFVFSVILWFFVDKDTGLFVGIWVPSILSLAAAVRRPALTRLSTNRGSRIHDTARSWSRRKSRMKAFH